METIFILLRYTLNKYVFAMQDNKIQPDKQLPYPLLKSTTQVILRALRANFPSADIMTR